MGFKDSILSIMSDFVEQKRNPEFRSKSELSIKSFTDDENPPHRVRRHSLSITCGTKTPDEQAIRQRSFSVRAPQMRRNTIVPEIASNNVTAPSQSKETVELVSDVQKSSARRFSEPFNAKLYEFKPLPVRRAANRDLLSDRPQLSSEESDCESEKRSPVTTPRDFQQSFEKRNSRFFGSSWRKSLLLDENPIQEEKDEDVDQTQLFQEPVRKITVIKIRASP